MMNAPHQPIATRYASEQEKHGYVRDLFNRSAPHYDRVAKVGFLGTGHFHRKRSLQLAGLKPGMDVIDVACGTGAVTRAIAELLDGNGRVVGVDPSEGMIAEARKQLRAEFVIGRAEALPVADEAFDFLSMGYALRHVEDLGVAFREYRRVLRPGGRLLILEISRPASAFGRAFSRLYFRDILPRVSRLVTGSRDAREMMAYYWETIDACVPPPVILEALDGAGFTNVKRRVELGICSQYTAERP
jgi:demethylmenaquinone methyltransferase/2-methoxy-6-polyprenyl-1,4-benzoquinol methylase